MFNFLCRFFDRDVNGVREYFRKRFGYESAGYPTYDELSRDGALDAEVSCSGLSKEMEKDLLQVRSMDFYLISCYFVMGHGSSE